MTAMPLWDVFHSERLEAERSLTAEAVRAGLARGEIVEDDLIRPAGSSRWGRLGDSPEFAGLAAGPAPPARDERPAFEPPSFDDVSEGDLTRFELDPNSHASLERAALARAEREPSPVFDAIVEDEDDEDDDTETAGTDPSLVAVPVDDRAGHPDLPELDEPAFGPEGDEEEEEEDDEESAAEFTLSRDAPETVEELDLAAMVDVAFQLVLFFLVTTATVVFKTLEVPRPNEDKPPEAAAQGKSKSMEELKEDYILVEVDAAGALKVDRQPVAADRAALAERLRAARQATGRKAMLLSADFATRHENAVMAFDVANEVELSIAIAQPAGKK